MKSYRKWSRPLLYGVLAATLTASAAAVPVSVYAAQAGVQKSHAGPSDGGVSREAAISTAMKIAGDTGGFTGPEVTRTNRSYRPNERRNVWEIRWRKEGPSYQFIEVTVDADNGLILQFSKSGNEKDKKIKFPPEFSYEDAVKEAGKFVQTTYGSKMTDYVLDERSNEEFGKILRNVDDSYIVRFIAKVNGIPFPSNSIQLNIDGTGEIIGLYMNGIHQVDFQSAEGVHSKDEVLKKLAEQLPMRLAYQPQVLNQQPGNSQTGQRYFLSYDPAVPVDILDARSGEILDYSGKKLEQTEGDERPLASSPQGKPPALPAKPLTQEEAVKRIEKIIKIPDDVTVSSISQNDEGGRKVWRIQLEYQTLNHGTGWTGGAIDAETGEVLQADISTYFREKYSEQAAFAKNAEKNVDYPVSYKEAEQKALLFLKETCGDKLNQLYSASVGPIGPASLYPTYQFSYERRVNGVAVPSNRITVTISAETGDLLTFYQNWTRDLPDLEVGKVIDASKAKQIFLSNLDLQLVYQIMNEKELYGMPPQGIREKQGVPEAKAVYRMVMDYKNPYFIDAHTGKLLSPLTGKEVDPRQAEKTVQDIAGHWAEKELNYMIQLGAIDVVNGRVKPDEGITRGQFIDMFMGVVVGSRLHDGLPLDNAKPSFTDVPAKHPDYGPVEWAVDRGILKGGGQFRPDAPLAREEAARILVRAMGLERLAEEKGLFAVDFVDKKDIDYPGQAAIMNAAGIMTGDGKHFFPDQAMTRAQAAVSLFRFLEKGKEYRPDIRF